MTASIGLAPGGPPVGKRGRQLARNVASRTTGTEVAALRLDGRLVERCGVALGDEAVDLKMDCDELALSHRSGEGAFGLDGQVVGR